MEHNEQNQEQSRNSKPKQKRSFRFVIKFFQLIFALIVVFFASFFITLYVNSPTPKEDFSSGVELVSDLMDDGKKNTAPLRKSTTSTTSTNATEQKVSAPVPSSSRDKNLGFFQRIDRINNIKKSVNNQALKVQHYVFLKDTPKHLQQAIVAVEDARFFTHEGYDLKGIVRAVVTNVEAGEIEEGGSTITQQLAKNLFLSGEQSLARKVEELFLAMNIEDEFPKDKILEMYLNTIYFGSNYYGIYDAAQGYFGKEPKDLTLAESAMLAGLPNAPSLYSPYVNFMLAKKRQLTVIDAMLREKVITATQAEDARIEEIVLVRE